MKYRDKYGENAISLLNNTARDSNVSLKDVQTDINVIVNFGLDDVPEGYGQAVQSHEIVKHDL